MRINRRTVLGTLATSVAAGLISPTLASAQSSQPVSIVMPYAGGGSIDALMRMIAELMNKDLGRPVLIENKPGANGIVGAQYVARARNDGTTLLAGGTGPVSLNVMLRSNLGYAVEDFASVAMLFDGPLALTINSEIPAKTLPEFIDWAKERGGPVRYAMLGPGSVAHLFGLIMGEEFGIPVVGVSYRNNNAATTDLLGKQIDVSLAAPVAVAGFVKEGSLRTLAITAEERQAQLADVPTLVELGYPKLVASFWIALHAPKGTPKETIDLLNAAANRALTDAGVRARLETEGLRAGQGGPEVLDAQLEADKALWGEIIKAENLSLD